MSSVIDLPGKQDRYQGETEVETLLKMVAAERNGGGVRSTFTLIAWTEEEAARREAAQSGNGVRVVASECDFTRRAMLMMNDDDPKGAAALMHYHFKSQDARSICRVVKCHHQVVPAILKRAHSNFFYYRGEAKRCGPIAYAQQNNKL